MNIGRNQSTILRLVTRCDETGSVTHRKKFDRLRAFNIDITTFSTIRHTSINSLEYFKSGVGYEFLENSVDTRIEAKILLSWLLERAGFSRCIWGKERPRVIS